MQRAPSAPDRTEPAALPAGQAPSQVIEPGRRYGFGHGFTFRREAFGGILYHYEGVRPDPRVTFVDNAFLIDLLALVQARPELALDGLCQAARAQFGLDAAESARIDAFFATLIARGALVPR